MSRVCHEKQLLHQQVTDLNTRSEQIKTSHIEALKEADERSHNLERAKAESDRSLKVEINCLSRQLAMSAIDKVTTRSWVHQSERCEE